MSLRSQQRPSCECDLGDFYPLRPPVNQPSPAPGGPPRSTYRFRDANVTSAVRSARRFRGQHPESQDAEKETLSQPVAPLGTTSCRTGVWV